MKNWFLEHPWFSASLIMPCSAWTMIYGVGHIVAAFGGEFPWITPGRPFTHALLGPSLLISGIVSFFVGRRLQRRDDLESGDTDKARRRRASEAIWDRAERNKLEETHPLGH